MSNKTQNKLLIGILMLMVLFTVLVGILLVQVAELKRDTNYGKTESTSVGDSGVEIYLPEVYYAASGLTMEIYNSLMKFVCRKIF